MSIFVCGGCYSGGGVTPPIPVETFYLLLEDGVGFFQLEDGSGNRLLE